MKKSTAISISLIIMWIPSTPAMVISGLLTNLALSEGANMAIFSFGFAFAEQLFCAIASIILLIVFECRYRQRDRECIGYIITSSFMNIPTFALIIMRIASYLINPSGNYHSNGNEYNFWSSFAKKINDCFGVVTVGIFVLLCSIATISVLVKFCCINRKLKNPNYVYK
ncbi:MAG: hypothetical protein J6B75_08440 [Ruminococcus sp.]|nr:hypothetical protein [Ruminococcus sp.]